MKDVGNSTLAKMFEYSSVGRRLVFSLIGTVASSQWGRLLEDTQTVSPYLTLSYQDAGPKGTILLRRHTTALTAFLPAVWHSHHTTAVVAFTAILAEFLVVALSGLPYRSGQVQDEFFICGVSSLIILAIMILVIAAVSFWRRTLPHLPRKPNNAAAVMSYLADSRMVDDFEGAEKLTSYERNQWVAEQGKRYEYSLRRRSDGRLRWVVDHTSKHSFDDHASLEPPSWNPGHRRVVSQFDE